MSITYTYTPSYTYVIPIVAVVIGIILLLISLNRIAASKRYRNVQLDSYKNTRTPEQWEHRLGTEVEERAAQEADTTSGQQVWFSRYICGGTARHWRLVARGTKYELRKDLCGEDYSYDHSLWTMLDESEQANHAEVTIPGVDGHYICLIGWTTKSQQQIQSAFDETRNEYGEAVLPPGKCGKFLQGFASKIVSKSAVDRQWFNDNCKTLVQPGQTMPRPPPALISARILSQQQTRLQQPRQDDRSTALLQNMAINQQLLNQAMATNIAEGPPAYSRSHTGHHGYHHDYLHHHDQSRNTVDTATAASSAGINTSTTQS